MGMKVTLNVQEDAELRAAIKDMVRGAVTGIVRDEIKDMVKDLMGHRISQYDLGSAHFKQCMKEVAAEKLRTEGISSFTTDYVKPIVEGLLKEMLDRHIKSGVIETMLKAGVQAHIKALISSVNVNV